MKGMSLEYKVSLDNLTIVGVPKYTTSEIRSLLISKGFINQFWQTPYKRYNDNYTLIGGGMLQITHDKGFVDSDNFTVHQIRLEFNPNVIIMYKKLVQEYLDLIKLIQEPKITRKDIAVDVKNIDMNDFVILDYSSRKRIEYKTSSMILETLYFGSKHSNERIRIYNKALEQGLTSKVDDLKWWRIEAQLRKEKAEMRKINPFTKIRIVSKQDFLQYDVRTRAMLFYLQANPDSMKELSINARTKYKKMLGEQIEEWFIDVEGMVEESIGEIQGFIESWLNFAPMDVKEGFKVKGLESCLKMDKEVFSDQQRDEMKKIVEEWDEMKASDFMKIGSREDFENWVKKVKGMEE